MINNSTSVDNPSFNFSIEDTMEMGMGNQELLNGLIAPETVTTSSEGIEKLSEENKVEKSTNKGKSEKSSGEKDKETSKEDPNKALKSFFEDSEEKEEDEKTEKTEKEVEKDEEKEEDTSKESNKFSALAKDLFKLGVFNKEEGEDEVEITTPEDFLERFNLEKKKGAIDVVDNFIGQFGEDYQNAFEAIFVKGVDPKEYFGTYNNIQDFTSLDLKNEANQIAVIRQVLLDQGAAPEDITAEIERIKNYGDLETVAQRNHKVLVKKEATKLAQLEKDSETKLQQQTAIRNQFVTNVNNVLQEKVKSKEFDGIPINAKQAAELQDFLLTNKYKTPSGETLTEFDKTILELKRPENHAKKVKVALLLNILEKDPQLSTIQKTGITKKTDELFSELARQKTKSTSNVEKTNKSSSWFSS